MNPHGIDAIGLILAIVWLAFFSLFIRRWYVAAILGGLGFWLILDVTGRLLARLDSLRGWNPSDSIWTYTGWMFGIIAALGLISLKYVWYRLTRKYSNAS